jgi:hypothetical protein
MYLLDDIELFPKHSSDHNPGVEGSALLNNGFYYSVTIFDNYTDWKKIEVLEDQYTIEELEAIEKELFMFKKKYSISNITPPYPPDANQAPVSRSGSPRSAG